MIGYYVHHHGTGHRMRAEAITSHLDEHVVFFSSLPEPPTLRNGDRWIRLAVDVDERGRGHRDVTTNGRLHWAPVHTAGLARRSQQLLAAVAAAAPRRVVVDVSVEVAVLMRLAGIPVTVVAMPGGRADAAHQLAYDIADQILAPWPSALYKPAWLHRHRKRVHYVGAISRFDGRARSASRGDRRGVLLAGTGGSDLPTDALEQLRAATPHLVWQALGGTAGWVADVWSALDGADLVVTHAGQSAIADVASAGPPAVVLPQRRPFDEQQATASFLERAGIAVCVPRWPSARHWPLLVTHARALHPRRW